MADRMLEYSFKSSLPSQTVQFPWMTGQERRTQWIHTRSPLYTLSLNTPLNRYQCINIYIYINKEQKKYHKSQTGTELHENFHFWINYFFNGKGLFKYFHNTQEIV